MKLDLETKFNKLADDVKENKLNWKKTKSDGLDVDYVVLLRRSLADELFQQLQETIEYYTDELSKVSIDDSDSIQILYYYVIPNIPNYIQSNVFVKCSPEINKNIIN